MASKKTKFYDRVEVITIEGRVLVKLGKFWVDEQDNGKTLKVFEKRFDDGK